MHTAVRPRRSAPRSRVHAAQDGNTSLHLASSHGWTEVAKLLIENGARLDAKNEVRVRHAHRGPHAPLYATLTRARSRCSLMAKRRCTSPR